MLSNPTGFRPRTTWARLGPAARSRTCLHCPRSGPSGERLRRRRPALPLLWDDERRFEIRCELDAAFFHLYLPADNDGLWRTAEGETPKQLAALKTHFPTPRHAVGFILDQFPLVRQKDEKAHGRYRTKERILEIHDAMLAAQCSGNPYQSTLKPPPGQGPRAAKA